MARPKKRLPPQAVQVLVVCAAVLACAAIYLLVGSRVEDSPAIRVEAAHPSPEKTAPSPSATPVKGVRERVFISRLLEKGLIIEETGGAQERDYTISLGEGEEAYALRLSLGRGYVLGFTLSIPVMEKPELSAKNPTEIERRLLDTYNSAAASDHERLEALMPSLMDALATEGYFPPATALYWAGVAAKTREDGGIATQEAGGCLFTASYRKGGSLTLAAALE